MRASKNQFGMGLNMSPANGNVILSVEPGGMAAKDRRLRPGDSITALDGETLGSVKLSEALRLRAEAESANGAPVVQERGQPPGVRTHQLTVTRTHEVLADGSPPLRALTHVCRRSIVMLRKREQDLRWLVGNPFWLPAPLEPLFSRLSWSVPDVAYLLASCLTDHKVLLIGSDPTVLLPCAQALRALLAPLGFSSTYIPYLPATLLSPSDAHTLLCDSTSPFLVGTHVSLHQTIAADGQTLSDELVVADLDRGVVTPSASPHSDFFPTSIAGLGQMAPPVGGLIKALHPHVSADHFDEGAVQAACLQFVADLLNIGDGALTDSSHPTDLAAKATWQILRDFEEDVRLRCERDSDTKPHVKLLKAKLTDGLSASLASVCQKVNLAGGLAQQPEVAKSAFTRSGSLSRTDRPSSPFLSLVYASRAFRHWWLTHESESTHEQKMCVSYRSYDLNLADHLDDHKRALQCVEASLYDELEKAAAGAVKEAQDKFGFPPTTPPNQSPPPPPPAEAAPPPPQQQRAAAAAAAADGGGGGAKAKAPAPAVSSAAPPPPPPPPPPPWPLAWRRKLTMSGISSGGTIMRSAKRVATCSRSSPRFQ